jgi:hypothetical protein
MNTAIPLAAKSAENKMVRDLPMASTMKPPTNLPAVIAIQKIPNMIAASDHE